jgi:two-component system phosphate regulon sensor histidine kinase PhoR
LTVKPAGGPFPWRIFSRVLAFQVSLVLLGLGASGFGARYYFKQNFLGRTEEQLQDTLRILAHDVPAPASAGHWCADHARDTSFRFTLIGGDGRVLCDSHGDAGTMENHLDRPEVRDAAAHGLGRGNTRYSTTLRKQMLYTALRMDGSQGGSNAGAILRGAIPLDRLDEILRVYDRSLLAFLLASAAVLILFAIWTGRSLVFPMQRVLLKVKDVLVASTERSPVASLELDPSRDAFGEWSDLETSLERIHRDLSSKIESLSLQQEEQATLMGAVFDGILAVDQQELPLFYNSRFALLFGKGEMQKRSRLWEIFREPEILDAFRDALKKGRSVVVGALPFEHHGERSFFSVSVSPLRKTGAEVYGAVGIFHDVSELKRAEQMRIDFVANVSHELRTPLTAIKGYAETLALDLKAGKPAEASFLEVIARNTDRLMSLIHDLLDLSSLESADTLQKTELMTNEFTARVIEQMKQVLDRKQLRVVVRASALTVLADPKRLEQVLINLTDNASKYSPAGGQIEISWERGGEGVTLCVRDHGPGIPIEHQSRLFERFYRVDKARSRELGGTGLGLSIVKHIVQKHGGSVWVKSAPGQGASFYCRFP